MQAKRLFGSHTLDFVLDEQLAPLEFGDFEIALSELGGQYQLTVRDRATKIMCNVRPSYPQAVPTPPSGVCGRFWSP